MNDALFQVNAPGADVEKLVADIRAAVEKKMRDGAYADARIARAERTNLVNLRNEDQFLGFYLKCLHDAVFVDISDFEIRERRPLFGPLLIALKKVIWSLLKFYTGLQQRAPYIAIDRFVVTAPPNNPAQLNVVMRLVSVEIVK